jgi:hypothetical protein
VPKVPAVPVDLSQIGGLVAVMVVFAWDSPAYVVAI